VQDLYSVTHTKKRRAHIYIDGAYETECLDLISKTATVFKINFFFDIGANLGAYTLHFASLPLIERVYAFEPDPRNFAKLQANLMLDDKLEKVTTYNVALSNKNDPSVPFYISRQRSNNEMNKIGGGTSSLEFNQKRHTVSSSQTVPVWRLDSLVDLSSEKVAIKIDVEGHELAVLEGMSKLLRHNQCVLMVESFGSKYSEVHDFLEKAGFKLHRHFEHQENYLYIPKDEKFR